MTVARQSLHYGSDAGAEMDVGIMLTWFLTIIVSSFFVYML